MAIKTSTTSAFSALDFFSAASQDRENTNTTKDIPNYDTGVHVAPKDIAGSLLWIDSLYGDVLKKHEFLTQVAKRALPFPLQHPLRDSNGSSYHYVAPECVGDLTGTILDAWGQVEPIQLLLESHLHSQCAVCDSSVTRIPSITVLEKQVLHQYSGTCITLDAIGPREEFQRWALANGFSCVQHDSKQLRVTLDSGICSREQLASLSRVLESLWRLDNIVITCATENKATSYHKTGWCPHCQEPKEFPDSKSLKSYLRKGQLPKNCGEHLFVNDKLSLKQLLETPLNELEDIPSELSRVAELSRQLGISTHPLGMSVSRLSSHTCALLSIGITLYQPSSTLLLDIPQGLLASHKETLRPLLLQHATSRAIILLQDIFFESPPKSPPKPSNSVQKQRTIGSIITQDKTSYSIYSHSVLNLSRTQQEIHSLSGLVTEDVSQTRVILDTDTIGINLIPTFCHPPKGNTQTIADVLGFRVILGNLYALGTDAKREGLSAKDFSTHRRGKKNFICRRCNALGLLLSYREGLHRPEACRCPVCEGTRFGNPLQTCTFKGISYGKLFDMTLQHIASVFTHIPKMSQTLSYAAELSLNHLPIGMPIALLSHSELRRLRLLEVITTFKKTLPNLILLEDPNIGWGTVADSTIQTIIERSTEEYDASWILVRQ